jgi:hypothetical protein
VQAVTPEAVQRYLERVTKKPVELLYFGKLSGADVQGMKGFGYGKPLLVRWKVDGRIREAVFSTMRGDEYGHQFFWDRAAVLMFQYETGGRMSKHVKPLNMGYVNRRGDLVPVAGVDEFFMLSEKIEGYDYYLDLERIRKGDFRVRDLDMAREFAVWLAGVHAQKKKGAPDLYQRRIRDLVGASECIFGLIDSYPEGYAAFPKERFIALEQKLVEWRWKLKSYSHRLSAVHGDFHPWNVLIEEDGGFKVLDRSRGEWGEPAGDVVCMAINYVLYGIYDRPRLSGHFETLYMTLWEEYLERTGDEELLETAAPFIVFRGLVTASPQWYPDHPPRVREGLFRLIENVLNEPRFDYTRINEYME